MRLAIICAPCHPLKMEVKAFSGVPRAPGQSSEAADLERQMAGCCSRNAAARSQVGGRGELVGVWASWVLASSPGAFGVLRG